MAATVASVVLLCFMASGSAPHRIRPRFRVARSQQPSRSRNSVSRGRWNAGGRACERLTKVHVLLGPDGKPLRKGVADREKGFGSSATPKRKVNKADVFGNSFLDFHRYGDADPMDYDVVTLEYHDAEQTPIDYFFRSMDEMPNVELEALRLARGRVLDVGCGAGSHAIILQDKMGLDVTGLDLSEGAIKVARERGLRKALHGSIFDFKPGKGAPTQGAFWDKNTHAKYDTIMFLMNGVGLAGNAEGLDRLLQRARALLAPGGQILLDSTDLQYMYVSDDGKSFEFDFDPKEHYYGETLITVRYKGEEETFPWLFIDYEALRVAAQRNGLEAIYVTDESLIEEGRGATYLAKLVPREDNPFGNELRGAQVVDYDEMMRKNGGSAPIVGDTDTDGG